MYKYWKFPTSFLKKVWSMQFHSKARPKWKFSWDTEWGNDETYIFSEEHLMEI